MGVGGHRHTPAALPRVRDPIPIVHVGPRTGLDGCGKSRLPPGFDPRTVQSLAIRYTGPLYQRAPAKLTDRFFVLEH